VESGFLLDIVVRKSAAILELLSSKDESLLIWRDSFLILDLLLDVVDGIGAFHFEGDGFAGEGLDEDLHSSSESEDQMESGFLLDVVVAQSAAILKLLSSENESLLIWGDSFLILDLLLDVVDGVGAFHFEGDGFACEGFDEDLHSSSKSKNEVESGFLLDVVVAQSAAILELLSSENESLLIWRDSFLILDLLLDVVNGVRRLHFESNGFAGEGLDEDLHSSSESEDQMESGFLLDVVVRKSAAILKLLSSEK